MDAQVVLQLGGRQRQHVPEHAAVDAGHEGRGRAAVPRRGAGAGALGLPGVTLAEGPGADRVIQRVLPRHAGPGGCPLQRVAAAAAASMTGRATGVNPEVSPHSSSQT